MNFAPGSTRNTTGIRWNEELEVFELLCNDCRSSRQRNPGSAFWPLTREFWQPEVTMKRCRACEAERKRKVMRRRRAARASEQRASL